GFGRARRALRPRGSGSSRQMLGPIRAGMIGAARGAVGSFVPGGKPFVNPRRCGRLGFVS
ncbi:MAG: hypothetical protein WAS21_05155, partial [Geminicoccaceae bacterium]